MTEEPHVNGLTIVSNSVLVLVLGILLWILCRTDAFQRRPAIRQVLWFLLLVKLVTPSLFELPLLPFGFSTDAAVVSTHTQTDTASTKNEGSFARTNSLGPTDKHQSRIFVSEGAKNSTEPAPYTPSAWTFALIFSLTGSAIFVVMVFHHERTMSLLLNGAELPSPEWNEQVSRVAEKMRLNGFPRVQAVNASISPLLWVSHWRPRIVLPIPLLNQLSQEQRAGVIAHELAHYLRRDHWLNWFMFVISALYWWHPMVWVARRELAAAQEVCSDSFVINLQIVTRRAYAEAVMFIWEMTNRDFARRAFIAPGMGTFSLQRRFEMLSQPAIPHRLSWNGRLLVGVLVMCLPCVVMPQQPTIHAEQQPPIKVESGSQSSRSSEADQSSSETAEDYLPSAMSFLTNVSDPRRLADLTDSSSLGLQGSRIDNESFLRVVKFPNLNELGLYQTSIDEEGSKSFGELTRLARLSLVGSKTTDAWLDHLPENSNLKELDLTGSRITDVGLRNLKKFPNLERLYLRRTAIGDEGLAVLQHLPKLKSLSLTNTQVSDNGLLNLQYVPKLENFSLGSPNVKGPGTKNLLNAPNLKELQFVGSGATNDWMKPVEPLRKIEWMELHSTKITSEGLAAIKNWTQLRSLYLNYNPISDEVVPHLEGLFRVSTMELNNTKVTAEGLSRLRMALPDASIQSQTFN